MFGVLCLKLEELMFSDKADKTMKKSKQIRQMKNQPDQSRLLNATSLCAVPRCSLLLFCSLLTQVFALIPNDQSKQ